MKPKALIITALATTSLLAAASCGKDSAPAKGEAPTAKATPQESPPPPAPPPAPDFIAAPAPRAIAKIAPASGSKVSGVVRIVDTGVGNDGPGQVEVEAELTGLPPGDHGFHIHEKGDCSAPDATSAGGHFNPASAAHGDPTTTAPHHLGDLGNLHADADGKATKRITIPHTTIFGYEGNSILGRAVIVHADPDDLKTQPTGGAGARIGCGVIESLPMGAGPEDAPQQAE